MLIKKGKTKKRRSVKGRSGKKAQTNKAPS